MGVQMSHCRINEKCTCNMPNLSNTVRKELKEQKHHRNRTYILDCFKHLNADIRIIFIVIHWCRHRKHPNLSPCSFIPDFRSQAYLSSMVLSDDIVIRKEQILIEFQSSCMCDLMSCLTNLHLGNPQKIILKEWFTLSMLKLLSSMAEKCKRFWKPAKLCHVGIHWKSLVFVNFFLLCFIFCLV